MFADHGPALGGPPAFVAVAALLDETEVRATGDRRGVQVEGRHLAFVRGAFVVQGPWLGGGAHRERAAGNEDFDGQGLVAGGRGRRGSGERGRPRPELMRDQHGLVVLLFVLGDHPEGEPGPLQRPSAPVQRGGLQEIQRPAPYVRGVRPGLGGVQQRQRGA